jgi:hypothetical protein
MKKIQIGLKLGPSVTADHIHQTRDIVDFYELYAQIGCEYDDLHDFDKPVVLHIPHSSDGTNFANPQKRDINLRTLEHVLRLAKKLGAACVNVDDLNDTIPNFSLATDLDKSMDLAIQTINNYTRQGKDVVANYVLRQKDFDRFADEIETQPQFVITLAPRLEIAQSQRGDRILTNWEVSRIKHHYDSGITAPKFGHIIDNSELNLKQTVDKILDIIQS